MHLSHADAQSVLQVTLPDLPVALSAKFLLSDCGLVISFPLHGGRSQPAAHSARAAHPVFSALVPAVDGI